MTAIRSHGAARPAVSCTREHQLSSSVEERGAAERVDLEVAEPGAGKMSKPMQGTVKEGQEQWFLVWKYGCGLSYWLLNTRCE